MATLYVALQDGFVGDEVVVMADEREVYRRESVTTRTQIGLADAFEVGVISTAVTVLRVSLPERRIAASRDIATDADRHVAVSVIEGVLEFRESEERFRYA